MSVSLLGKQFYYKGCLAERGCAVLSWVFFNKNQ